MNPEQLKNIVEAALMAADGPLNVNQLLALFESDPEQPERSEIRQALEQLAQDYAGRGVELQEVASGFRFQVCNDYADWVNRLQEERSPRYSRALLETLAIIAYRQPVTRSEIEDVRGVSISSGIIKTLQEREWIRVVGHRDVPGKPELLATTRQFLDYFNLKNLSDLPPLSEIKDFDKINPDLFESLENADSQTQQENIPAETDTAGEEVQEETTASVVEESSSSEEGNEQDHPGEQSITDDEEDIGDRGNVVPFSG